MFYEVVGVFLSGVLIIYTITEALYDDKIDETER